MAATLNIKECVSSGWNAFRKNIGVSLGITAIYLVIAIVAGIHRITNFIFTALISPALMGGIIIFSLKAARNEKTEVGNLFEGFQKFGRFLGAYWLIVVIVIVSSIPSGIGFAIDYTIGSGIEYGRFVFTIIFSIISLAIMVYLMLRVSLVLYLIADDYTIIDSFKESSRMTTGYKGTLLLLYLLLLLIIIAGFICLLVGVIAAIPLTYIIFAYAYLKIKENRQPAAE